MFKVGNRVVLIKEHPDENEELLLGDTGTVLKISDRFNTLLVRWDKSTSAANGNNHLIEDYYDVYTNAPDNPEEYNDTYYEHTGHLWYTYSHEIKVSFSIEFREQKRSETQLAYKIARKIAELDYKWKEKQSAKAGNLSL